MAVDNAARGFALAGALAAAAALPALAQEPAIVDGSQVEVILAIAQAHGPASLEAQPNGDPRISGQMDGLTYQASFSSCIDNTACRDMTFQAGFLDSKLPLEVINAWNRDTRFGTAYLDSASDACVSFDLTLEHGVTRGNLEAAFTLWRQVLARYTAYIGYE